MKITQAYITDPRKGGDYRNPYLTLEVDEILKETGNPVDHHVWLVTPHGPFVAVDHRGNFNDALNGTEWIDGDLGDFNTTKLYKDRLVEAVVLDPKSEINLAMSLDRARRMLRKFNLPWRYVLDDVAGQHGKLVWRLTEHTPKCVRCGKRAVTEAYYRGTHLSLCEDDLGKHNKMIRNLRVNS